MGRCEGREEGSGGNIVGRYVLKTGLEKCFKNLPVSTQNSCSPRQQ